MFRASVFAGRGGAEAGGQTSTCALGVCGVGTRRHRQGDREKKAECAAEDETRGEERQGGMSVSGQLSAVSDQPVVIRARGTAYYGICCVKGCGSLATVDTETGIYCEDCWNEGQAPLVVSEDGKTYSKTRAWIARLLWIPEAIFVACAFGFLLFKVFVAFYEWFAAGGVQ
jgi:hypothetical protein